jgi:poly(A) polymerase
VRQALQKLDDAGHLAYVVGGSVRDFLLGRGESSIKDHDIATSASPKELEALFPTAIEVGKAFGVLKIPLERPKNDRGKPEFLEIATFRSDLEYEDHRHPTGILLAGPIEDARRRDFTVNALFYDSKTARVLDTVGGLSDLKARRLRAIGDPRKRFREDALRLLRAPRLAAALGFSLEPETEHAIRTRARLVLKVSAERVREELRRMLEGQYPVEALGLLTELGLFDLVLPELTELRQSPGAWKATLKLLRSLLRLELATETSRSSAPEQAKTLPGELPRDRSLRWAALFLRAASPQAVGARSTRGFELASAALWRKAARRLRFSSDECERVRQWIEAQVKFRDAFQMREATLQRFVRSEGFEEALLLHRADAVATDGNLAPYDFCRARLEEYRAAGGAASDPKLLGGEDLIQLGFEPGPRFSEILSAVEDLALERRLTTKREALDYVLAHFVR